MKILWLSHNVPYPPVGGVLQRNYHLVRQAASRFELHLIALRQDVLMPEDSELDEAVSHLSGYCASVSVFRADWETSRFERMKMAARVVTGPRPYDLLRYASSRAEEHLKSWRLEFDLVHVDTIGLIPLRPSCNASAAVLNHHNIESSMMSRRADGERDPARRLLFRMQARRLARWETRHAADFECNFTVSELDRDRLLQIAPGSEVVVVPNGCDTDWFDLPANGDPSSRDIVFFGGQSWYPNRDAVQFFLEEIWPLIVREDPRARFVMVGASPCPEALEAASRDERVQVHGFVDDLRPIVERAAVFVCPYRQGGGTRLKVLDGLAMRKAMVTTSVGAEGVPLDDGVHCLIAEQPGQFAQKVLRLLGEPQLRVRLGNNGREFIVRHFDWRVIGETLCGAYRAAAERATARRVRAQG